MKKALILSVLLMSSASFAKTYVCTFTEPFITVKYYETHQLLTSKFFDERTKIHGLVEKISRDSNKQITILDDQANSVLSMSLTGQGSDGMSDMVYPYEAVYRINDSTTVTGGCKVKKGLLSSKNMSQQEIQNETENPHDSIDSDLDSGSKIDN